MGPDALGVPGPCFAARETSENLQMISQRRKRLAFAPAASDVRFGDCVKRPSALALERRRRCDPSHAPRGRHALWPGGVMAAPTLCHASPTGAVPFASPGFRLPSVVATRQSHSRPNTASVKLNSLAGPIYAQTRRALPEKRVCRRRWRLAFLNPLRSWACSKRAGAVASLGRLSISGDEEGVGTATASAGIVCRRGRVETKDQ